MVGFVKINTPATGGSAGGPAVLTEAVRRISGMAVRTVIFDWGGTLTPWHSIDIGELWLPGCARHYPADEAAAMAAAVHAAEAELWQHGTSSHQSATLEHVFERAGVTASD